jgi:hypothetical protein
MTTTCIEILSKTKQRSIKSLRAKSSSAVEGSSKIIEIELIIIHDGFAYFPIR